MPPKPLRYTQHCIMFLPPHLGVHLVDVPGRGWGGPRHSETLQTCTDKGNS